MKVISRNQFWTSFPRCYDSCGVFNIQQAHLCALYHPCTISDLWTPACKVSRLEPGWVDHICDIEGREYLIASGWTKLKCLLCPCVMSLPLARYFGFYHAKLRSSKRRYSCVKGAMKKALMQQLEYGRYNVYTLVAYWMSHTTCVCSHWLCLRRNYVQLTLEIGTWIAVALLDFQLK